MVTQESDEDVFEYNVNKIYKEGYDNEQENKNEEKKGIYMENQEMFQ